MCNTTNDDVRDAFNITVRHSNFVLNDYPVLATLEVFFHHSLIEPSIPRSFQKSFHARGILGFLEV
jgi:hypothetical protein